MSREIMTALSFHKDFRGADYTCYSSNIYPRDPYKSTHRCKDDKTTLDYMKSWVADVLGGSIELPKNHKLQVYCDLLRKDYDYVSLYDEEMRDKWVRNKKGNDIEWLDQEAKAKWDAFQNNKDNELVVIAQAFMNDSYKNEIKELKSKKYVLTDGRIYIKSVAKKSYRYTYDFSQAKIYNGFEVNKISKYFRDKYTLQEVTQ